MAVNPLLSLSLDPNPMLMWKKVPDATSYKFKLVNKETFETLWEIEVTKWQSEGDYCNFDYPKDKPPLKPLVPYVLIGETDETPSKKGQGELIVLEEDIGKIAKTFDSEFVERLKATPEKLDNLTEQWGKVLGYLLSANASAIPCRKTRPRPNCMSISFEDNYKSL